MKYRKTVNRSQETPAGCCLHRVAGSLIPGLFILLVAAGFLAAAQPVLAQDFNEEPVKISGRTAAVAVAPGGTVDLLFTLTIDAEFYLYQHMVSLALKDPAGWSAADPVLPPAEVKFDKIMEEEVPIYAGEITLRLPVTAPADLPEGPVTLVGVVGYQCCTSSYCLMPTSVEVPVSLSVSAEAAAAAGTADTVPAEAGRPPLDGEAPAAAAGSDADRLTAALERGLLWALPLVFLFGILASLTPCVYPMIPITISVIGARSAGGRMKGFTLSLFYVLGIAVTYSTLGMIAALTGGIFGAALQNPWVLGGIAVIFVLLGLSMFGLFELQLPSSVSTKLGSYQGKGYFGVLVMGAITGLVASPCVGPIIVALLAYVAQTRSVFIGFILLFTFSLGMGVLFVLIGTFSGIMVNLPRSGNWMVAVRNVFGFLMIAVAFYFARQLIPGAVFAPLLGSFLLCMGLVTGWPRRVEPEPSPEELAMQQGPDWMLGIRRTFGLLLASAGLYLVIGSLLIHGFILPPLKPAGLSGVAGAPADGVNIAWITDEREALRLAGEEGKPLMIDFTADWCAACKELDHFTYADQRVADELKRFVSAQIDFTVKDDETERLRTKYGIPGLPTVIFFDSEGKQLDALRLNGFVDAEEMLRLLKGIS